MVSAAGHEDEDRQGHAQEMNGEGEGGSEDPSPPRSNTRRAKGKVRDHAKNEQRVEDEEPIYQNLTVNSPGEKKYYPIKGNDIEFAVLPGR